MTKFLSIFVCLLLLAGCGGRTAPRRTVTPAAPPAATSTYELDVTPPAPARPGQSMVARLMLLPREPFKVNVEYPVRLDVRGPDAAHPRRQVLAAGRSVKVAAGQLVAEPAFAVTRPGQHRFSGTLSFGLCTNSRCETYTEPVSWIAQVH